MMTTHSLPKRALRAFLLATALSGLSACAAVDRLSNIGRAPELSQIQNPTAAADYRPVSMPMPAPVVSAPMPNSLWQPGTKAFFEDQRADRVGDILTVVVNIDDSASLDNETERTRDNENKMGVGALFGFEGQLEKILSSDSDSSAFVGTNSTLDNDGKGTIDRTEAITVSVAAVVTQVLPNGNMVIFGRQETRVNFEVRELLIAGIIRPEDITSNNTIPFEKVAEARLSYGGRGQLTDVQQPRYGDQVLDIILPF